MTSITELVDRYGRFRSNVLNLQASENYICPHVRMALGSDLGSRYAHIMPDGNNAYGGTSLTDEIYKETQDSIKKLYNSQFAEVRPIGGHVAAEIALLISVKRGGKIMAIDENHGGYTGYMKGYLPEMFGFSSGMIPYIQEKQEIDYERLEKEALTYRPDAIVLGQSFFLKPYDLKRIRELCDRIGSKLLYDGSHVMGLIAGKKFQNDALKYSDILFGSTHKSFFGPQGGILLTNQEELFHQAEFNTVWRTMDNYHPNRVAALGIAAQDLIAFGEDYASKIVNNSKGLGKALEERGIPVQFQPWYSESHQILLSPKINERYGSFLEISRKLEKNGIICDREGRIGLSEATRRGFNDMDRIASAISEAIKGKDMRSEITDIMRGAGLRYCK